MINYQNSRESYDIGGLARSGIATPGTLPGTLFHRAQSGQGFFRMPAIRTICA